jgi:hypothetical protein
VSDTYQAAEALRQFVLAHGLPHTDMALIGLGCPYCGKFDRIRRLEAPLQINGRLPADELARYAALFDGLLKQGRGLGVCKFCQNPVRLIDNGRPETLEDLS